MERERQREREKKRNGENKQNHKLVLWNDKIDNALVMLI